MTLPVQMTDRWRDRHTDGSDEGTVYWHMLMGDQPKVPALRSRLSSGWDRSPQVFT